MILVFNVGSTSIKYKVFDSNKEVVFAQKIEYPTGFDVQAVFDTLLQRAIISDISNINLVAHRVVFGGQNYIEPTLLTDEVVTELEKMSEIAPLHNPPALNIIKQIRKRYPTLTQKAVFDTVFHCTLEPKSFLYGLPYQYYEKYGVRKYGFHGISHSYIAKKVEKLEKNSNLRVISCHLGGGCSVCAIKDGKSVDISMGFSPEEGLVMASRSGNVGAGAILFLQKKLLKTPDEMLDILNHQSGLLGISEIGPDMRDLVHLQDSKAQLAIEIYCQNIAKYIGSFVPVLGGMDVLTFTGAVGEGSSIVREKVCKYLGYLDLGLDTKVNKDNEEKHLVARISKATSKVKVWVIPADEEAEILSSL